MSVTAVIPCFNEEQNIASIVRRAKIYCHRVIVVDNMSTDDTMAEASKETPYVYSNYTKGAGATTGIGLARSLNPLPHLFSDIIVTLDGDDQHDPDDIPVVVAPIEQGIADMVVGSRFIRDDHEIQKYRKLGIDIITWAFNVGAAVKLTDAQCCLRAFSRTALEKLLPVEETGFGFSVEMLVKARQLVFRIMEVPVNCIYHQDNRDDSTINPLRHGVSVLANTVKWRLREATIRPK